MSINYGKLQELILEHGADSARVSEMCDILGTTVEKAEQRIANSADKIERDKRRAVLEALGDSLKGKLADHVLVGKDTKPASDWAAIAHELKLKARELTAQAKPITTALEAFRQGVMAELIAQGECEQGTAFTFRVVRNEAGDTIVTWKSKGMRLGGGVPNGTLVGALDGETMSWTKMYSEVVGKVYSGRNSHSKQMATDAPEGFDWSRVSYDPSAGAPSAIEDLERVGAIAADLSDATVSIPIEGAMKDILQDAGHLAWPNE